MGCTAYRELSVTGEADFDESWAEAPATLALPFPMPHCGMQHGFPEMLCTPMAMCLSDAALMKRMDAV